MLNLNTILFPLEVVVEAHIVDKEDAPLVVVDKRGEPPTLVFKLEPPKEVNSFPVLVATQSEAPFVPSRYKVPEPKLDVNNFGQFGEVAAAVPPFVVVWKSHAAIKPEAAALTVPLTAKFTVVAPVLVIAIFPENVPAVRPVNLT